MNSIVMPTASDLLWKVRLVLVVFIAELIVSGLTAFPLLHEVEWIASVRGVSQSAPADIGGGLDFWIVTVRDGLRDMHQRYPWIAYGTDWLAFAHFAIAIFFVGPVIDPVRNVWVLRAGLIACVGVIPLAMICGAIRHIPMGWRLIDCCFGVLGALPLIYCLRLVRRLESNPS